MRNKYGAKRTFCEGLEFASKKEARRYGELVQLARAGLIWNLTTQPRFPLKVNGALVCTYVGDFDYLENNTRVIEDAKGFKTPTYKIKRKLLLALHPGLDHREV